MEIPAGSGAYMQVLADSVFSALDSKLKVVCFRLGLAGCVAATVLLVGVQSTVAATITISADATAPAGSNADNTSGFPNGLGLPDTSFVNQAFKSSGWPNGGLFTNRTGSVIQDLEITLISGDTFAAGISGGKAFPTVTYSADMKTVTFSGGNIPSVPAGVAATPDNMFWLKIPKSADFPGGVGMYRGNATPVPPPPKPAEKTSTPPEGGNKDPDNNVAQITYNATTGSFQFSPGAFNFVEYQDGTVATANSASESIIGSFIEIDPTSLIGLSPDVAGAFQLADSYLVIARDLQDPTENVFLSGALVQLLLIPQSTSSGFDSVLQATISPQEAGMGLGSSFLGQLLAPNPGGGLQLDFETNLLAATHDLTVSGSSTGNVLFNINSVPEPSTVVLFAGAALGLMGYGYRKKNLRTSGVIPPYQSHAPLYASRYSDS
jgi:hypothetical protein